MCVGIGSGAEVLVSGREERVLVSGRGKQTSMCDRADLRHRKLIFHIHTSTPRSRFAHSGGTRDP
eukprot:736101-Prymnesium_polylepis.2